MKPLILEYSETPDTKQIDFSLIEYSYEKNLNVLKNTETPAIVASCLDTETFTKAHLEGTDSDSGIRKELKNILDTNTYTLNSQEPTDNENNFKMFSHLLDTELVTESKESTDSDKDK